MSNVHGTVSIKHGTVSIKQDTVSVKHGTMSIKQDTVSDANGTKKVNARYRIRKSRYCVSYTRQSQLKYMHI